jgi:hypothetical protein
MEAEKNSSKPIKKKVQRNSDAGKESEEDHYARDEFYKKCCEVCAAEAVKALTSTYQESWNFDGWN